MNIYIIGMPGSGKTTISKHLAEKLGFAYHDLDSEIEKTSHLFINQIFEQYGEETFRNLETKALEETLHLNDTVISCGGGVVTQKRNKKITEKGLTVYIDTKLDIIKKRLENDETRPLLKTSNLEKLFSERFLKYQDFSDYIVSNDMDIEKSVSDIENYLRKKNYL